MFYFILCTLKYDFKTNSRTDKVIPINNPEVVIIEGIFALHDPRIVQIMSLKIFIECDADTRLARRSFHHFVCTFWNCFIVRRDVKERGRTLDSVLAQYLRFVKVCALLFNDTSTYILIKPAYDNIISPSQRVADLIVRTADHKHGFFQAFFIF